LNRIPKHFPFAIRLTGWIAVLAWTPYATASCPTAFAPAVSYPAGAVPAAVDSGDIDGDGVVDLVVANSGPGSTTISILRGNGDGTFQAAQNAPAGSRPVAVALGDLNGDGALDVVVCNSGLSGNSVSTVLNTGAGTFAPPATFSVPGGPLSPAIADLNGDERADVVVAVNGANRVAVLLGNGDGALQPAVNHNVGMFPQSVVEGDFDADGDLDLAASNAGSGDVSILLNNGDGTFAAAVSYPAGSVSSAVAMLDVNNDGALDLVTSNDTPGGTVHLLVGNGNGTFQAATPYATGNTPVFVAVGDVNGDGQEDLATANFTPGTVSILRAAAPTFAPAPAGPAFNPPTNLTVGANPKWILITDLSHDGRADLAVVDANGVRVLINSGLSLGITQQPASQSHTVGDDAMLFVTVVDAGPQAFQWRKNGVNLLDGGRISGAKSAALSITAAIESDTGAYDVVITGGCNGTIPTISRPAALCIIAAPPCRGDFNEDNQFDAADIQAIVDALLASKLCP
jgi:hypothetical protein